MKNVQLIGYKTPTILNLIVTALVTS